MSLALPFPFWQVHGWKKQESTSVRFSINLNININSFYELKKPTWIVFPIEVASSVPDRPALCPDQ
jgi:hypothetical protein